MLKTPNITLLFITLGLLPSCEDSVSIYETPDRRTTDRTSERESTGPILFVSRQKLPSGGWGPPQLYSMREDGSDVRPLLNDPHFPVFDARWSPDQKNIALTSPVGGLTFYGPAIYVMKADGSKRYLLTKRNAVDFNSGTGYTPTWSPDSRRIAFTRIIGHESSGNLDLFVINVDGTGEQQLTNTFDTTEYVSDWARDGGSLLGAANDPTAHDSSGRQLPFVSLAVFGLDGRYMRTWGQVGLTIASGKYSTAGDRIVFLSSERGRIDMYLMTAAFENKQLLTNRDYTYYEPVAWSRDDTKILYNAGRSSWYERVLTMDVRTGTIVDITPFASDGSTSYAVSWRK